MFWRRKKLPASASASAPATVHVHVQVDAKEVAKEIVRIRRYG